MQIINKKLLKLIEKLKKKSINCKIINQNFWIDKNFLYSIKNLKKNQQTK